jgi:hypothetical protein
VSSVTVPSVAVSGVDAGAHDVREPDSGLTRRLRAEAHVELQGAGIAGATGHDLDEEHDEIAAFEVAALERLDDLLVDDPVPELAADAGLVVVGLWSRGDEVELDVAGVDRQDLLGVIVPVGPHPPGRRAPVVGADRRGSGPGYLGGSTSRRRSAVPGVVRGRSGAVLADRRARASLVERKGDD